MGKYDDGSAGGEMLDIGFQPCQLLLAKPSHAASLQVNHVDQSDEMDSLNVKALPARALCVLAVALAKRLSVVFEHVMLSGNEKDVLRTCCLQDLVDLVELLRPRQMTDVAGVQYELGSQRQRVDLVHRGL